MIKCTHSLKNKLKVHKERGQKTMEIAIIRKLDATGRIVIPKDIRATLSLGEDELVRISVENGTVVIKKATEEE